jgi:hypothetical protein
MCSLLVEVAGARAAFDRGVMDQLRDTFGSKEDVDLWRLRR